MIELLNLAKSNQDMLDLFQDTIDNQTFHLMLVDFEEEAQWLLDMLKIAHDKLMEVKE